MKKAVSLSVCLAVLLLTACGRATDADVSSAADTSAVAEIPETYTAEDRLSANDTYGDSARTDDLLVRDESVRYRTEDSYRLEPIAVHAAEDMLRSSMMQPESLWIRDCVVSDCADDADNTYYTISFYVSYTVGSGQPIDSGELFMIGVRKADESTFDASGQIARVLEEYSIFRKTEQLYADTPDAGDTDGYASAAREIAASHLKNADSGKILYVKHRTDISDDTLLVYEVLCEGENDYGMRITDVFTAYLASNDGKIIEIDPADPNANIF